MTHTSRRRSPTSGCARLKSRGRGTRRPRLDDSGCPVPETATCKFLASAVDCKQMLPGMIESLEDAKKKHRERYDELKAAVDQAKAAIDEIGDPLDELSDLERREQELRSIASKEAEVAAAEASVEKIEASIKEAKEAADKAVAHIEEIDAEREKLTQSVTAYQEAEGDVASFSGLADTLAECQAGASKAEALAPQIRKLKAEVEELRGKSEQALREAEEIAARVPGGGNVVDRSAPTSRRSAGPSPTWQPAGDSSRQSWRTSRRRRPSPRSSAGRRKPSAWS